MKQKEPARMTAAQARVDIWEKLRKVARPDSRFSWEFSEFITHRIITWKSSESRPSWTKKLSS